MTVNIKVLVISHACLIGYWREKFDLLSRYPDIKLSILVPSNFPILKKDAAFKSAMVPNKWEVNYKVFTGSIIFKRHLTKYIFSSSLRKALSEKPDIIDVELGPWSFLTAEVLFMKRLFSNDSLTVFRAVEGFRKDRFIDRLVEYYAYRQADASFAITRRAERRLRQKGFTKPIKLTPNFVNTDIFKKLDMGREEKEPVVGYIGRLAPGKGVATLIQAMAGLKAHLRLIGDGQEKEKLKQLIVRHRISSEMIGFIPHQDIPYFLNKMDILVLPSITLSYWEEYFGRILIEAMACEVAVIGSSCGAIPEIIGEAGLIFRENNVNELKKNIKILLEDKNRRNELGAKGRKRVEENFSTRVVSEKIYQAYKNLLRNV